MYYDPEGPTPDIDGDLLDDTAPNRTRPCEECGAEIYLDADVCPVCGAFQMHHEPPIRRIWSKKYIAYIVAGVLLSFLMWAYLMVVFPSV